jgi:hypothetical protein
VGIGRGAHHERLTAHKKRKGDDGISPDAVITFCISAEAVI